MSIEPAELEDRLTRRKLNLDSAWLSTTRTRANERVGYVPIVLWVALGFGAILRLWQLAALGYNSDEAVYAGQAAAIAQDPVLQEIFPIFRAHPLLFQFLVALAFTFGTNDLYGRLVAVAFGLATILLIYQFGSLLYGRRAGGVAALFLALMPYHVIVTRQVLLDGPMVFFATLTMYLLARFARDQRPPWLYAAGAGMGLTFLAKETGIVLLGAIFVFLALSPEIRIRLRDLFFAMVTMVLVIAPFPLTLWLAGGGGSQTTQQYLVWQLFRRPNHPWSFYPTTVPFFVGLLLILVALIGLWVLRRERSWRERLLVAWIAVPVLFFQLWPTKGFQYLLPIAPPVALLAARMLVHGLPARPGRIGRWHVRREGIRWLVIGVVALSLWLTSWPRVQGQASAQFLAGSGGITGGREAGQWVRENVPEGARLMTIGPSMANILQFYGHRQALGLSVSPNPLHRNPSYQPILNPDLQLQRGEINYIVWDAFSANRSTFFSSSVMKYVERYNGQAVHTEVVPTRAANGDLSSQPVIIIYEVRP